MTDEKIKLKILKLAIEEDMTENELFEIARERRYRINDLEKENADLKEQVEDWKADHEHNLDLMKGLNERIAELKKKCFVLEQRADVFKTLNTNEVNELKKDKEHLDKVNNEQTEVILKLNEQIEKMKRCGNCLRNKLFIENGKLKCEGNIVASFSSDTKINVCDKWELAE